LIPSRILLLLTLTVTLMATDNSSIVVGDKGFDSDPLRQQLEQLGASHFIPSKSNRRRKRRLNKRLYRRRYKVENYFCRLKRWASASTRRDKLASHFLALIQFASVIVWLRYGS
jgi:transposase